MQLTVQNASSLVLGDVPLSNNFKIGTKKLDQGLQQFCDVLICLNYFVFLTTNVTFISRMFSL